MHDCSDDVLSYHGDEVTLPNSERSEMSTRRNSNRDRLRRGLEKNKKPKPIEFVSQGSYEMRTMIQHPERDYDIDDGVYFHKTDLVGPRNGEMSSREAREMVRDALDDGSFNTAPEVRKNCVRVQYNAGYHVDVPVYRKVATKEFAGESIHYELASSDWKRSDARDVTDWFNDENERQSPDDTNGRQLRRIVRLLKKFARSRKSWGGKILSGFGITKLVTEEYRQNKDREDSALHDTMKAIRDRLNYNLVVKHPVTPGAEITNGTDDAKAKFFREKLTDALTDLTPLFEYNCTRERALACWDKVFNTDYFGKRNKPAETKAMSGPAILTEGFFKAAASNDAVRQSVQKDGGGRYA